MTKKLSKREEDLFRRVADIIESARGHVARTVNSAMVHAYWLIGREIVEVEQQGKTRAGYGDQLMEQLALRLSEQFGRGFGVATLRRVRQFYLTFPRGSALPPELGGPDKRSAALIDSQPRRIRSAVLIESGRVAQPLFPSHVSWAHYLILIRVERHDARAFSARPRNTPRRTGEPLQAGGQGTLSTACVRLEFLSWVHPRAVRRPDEF
ncbi:MAG: DUF1016 N-terminal domain-containing protein [Myxococcota bacterium]|jgi:hypothetical protein|nr:DUF1016 N-terminal domain-containing protein [Myxococcota bacterium]